MRQERQKVSKIMDELVAFFLQVGARDINFGIHRQPEGYILKIESDFSPSERERVAGLERLLNPAQRNVGLEEFYWELAGVSASASGTSELHLIGQMLERAEVKVEGNRVCLTLFRDSDGARREK